MPANQHVFELQIVERHLDTFGHVNNARYLEIFEEARWDWISARGYGLDTIQRCQQGPAVLRCSVEFLRELHNRERVRVLTQVVTYTGKTGELHQELVKASGDVACRASFVLGLLDLSTRRLIAPTPEWLRAIDFEAGYRAKNAP